ncbi:MAG: TRAP transporter substrate-binding protein [Cellvibrionales bacterium]|nr:TRAP transporter substrate-binding protein [Cellvibrionales bacterium]
MKTLNIQNVIILSLVAIIVALVAVVAINPKQGALTQGSSSSDVDASLHAGTIEWKMVTSWPKGFPGLGTAPEYFAEQVNTMSGGRLHIKVFAAGELVPALGVFDAVSKGSAEVGHSGAYYWKGKLKSSPFFTTIPFGMTAQEMNGWLYYGGGIELWREAYAPVNLYPLAAGNTGVQMAGWFNKEINSIEDIKGLKMRIPGLAGEIFTHAGGTAVNIAGGELYTALKTGVIDATEWVGPYNDLAMGFYEVAKYYYYPGWHEPGSTLELVVNKDAYAKLPKDLQSIVVNAAIAANQLMLSEYTARNNQALSDLIEKHNVQLKVLPEEVLQRFYLESNKVIDALIKEDPLAKRIYSSYEKFARQSENYHKVSEQAYMQMRERLNSQ